MRYAHAFALLALLVAAVFWRPIFLGEIVFPHDNDLELGLQASVGSDRITNRKFSDESSQYVPELHHHLAGDRSGWISTWNPHVELGRPSSHVAGISRAFWLTHALSWLTDDAFRLYSWLVVLAAGGAAFFALLLFRAEGLHPAAGFAASVGLGIGIYTAYWSTYALFVFGVAWTLALLWLIRRMVKAPDPLGALGIAIVVQALLLTGYPQQIIWHLWFVGIYTLHALAQQGCGIASSRKTLLWIGAAGALGVLASAPVYLDLAIDAARSARLDVPHEFFVALLPRVETLGDAVTQALQLIDVFVFGNPIEAGRQIPFDGISLAPLIAFGVAASFLGGGLRRLWPIHLFVAVALLATFHPPLYRFGIDYLGLSLSRFIPLTAAVIPTALLAARGFDVILRGTSGAVLLSAGFAGLLGVLLAAAAAIAAMPLVASGVLVCMVTSLLLIVFARSRSPWLLVAVAMVGAFVYAQPLLLTRPAAAIHRNAPLVEQLRALGDDGSRYAWVGRGIIPSNQESLLGLRSIHTYNSLSPVDYQRWVESISEGGTALHGRHFSAIRGRSRLDSAVLRRAGIGILVAPGRLDVPWVEPIGRSGRFWIHRTREAPQLVGRTTTWREDVERGVSLDDTSSRDALDVRRVSFQDDRARFEMTASDAPSLLWVSSKFHPSWRARSGEARLETLEVDGIYLGVRLPARTEEIELRFEPWARWAWVPQLAFLIAIPVVVWTRRRAGVSRNRPRSSSAQRARNYGIAAIARR